MPFRKRPPETHSGPGLETSYGCGESTSTAVFSIQVCLSASSSLRVLSALGDRLLQVLFVLLTQRESCSEVSSLPPLSVLLLLPSACLSPHLPETKPYHRQRRRPKSHQPYLLPKAAQGTLGCANAKQRTVYPRQSFADKVQLQRALAPGMPLSSCNAGLNADKRARQTPAARHSNGIIYLQDMQQVANGLLVRHWLSDHFGRDPKAPSTLQSNLR